MTAPRDLGPDFREWMHAVPSMPEGLVQHTLKHTRGTRQRRRWLPVLPGPRPATQSQHGPGDQSQGPAMEPGIRSLVPAGLGGTETKFSAPRMIGLAAVVAMLGAVLLVGGQLARQLPGTPTPLVDGPSEITGVRGVLEVMRGQPGTTRREGWGMALMDRQLHIVLDMDDPRLCGSGAMRLSEYNIKGLSRGSTTATFYIRNDEGSWSGDSHGYRGPEAAEYHFQLQLTGHDGYEGLTAILSGDQAFYGDDLQFSGVIVDGALPPQPGPAVDVVND